MPEHFCSALRSLYTRRPIAVLDIQTSPSQLRHRSLLHTLEGAPATPVPRLHLAIAPLPLGSLSLLRSYGSLHTYSTELIRVTSHLQRCCVIHTHCRYRSLNPTQARCLLHLAAVATSICSILYYPYFGDISAQDGRYLSCPIIWASFYWSPKKNWQGCLYRCWSWARYPSPHCGSGSTRTTKCRDGWRASVLYLDSLGYCCRFCAKQIKDYKQPGRVVLKRPWTTTTYMGAFDYTTNGVTMHAHSCMTQLTSMTSWYELTHNTLKHFQTCHKIVPYKTVDI